MADFTVLVPSIGRFSLIGTTDSFVSQKRYSTDQLLVLVDTHGDAERYNRCKYMLAPRILYAEAPIEIYRHDGGYNWLGVPQMNWALENLPNVKRTSHLIILGDDDVFVNGAFEILRPICQTNPNRPIIFQFVAPWRSVLPAKFEIVKSQISGCCIAVPIRYVQPHPLERIVEHDFYWIQSIVEVAKAEGHDPVWLEQVLVVARPDSSTRLTWPSE